MGVVRVMYTLKVAEISFGRGLKPNIPRELKLGYVLWLQRLKKTSGKAVGGKGLSKLQGERLTSDVICW